jgi:hypothetical protein
MPHYEFFCHSCKQAFSKVLTLAVTISTISSTLGVARADRKLHILVINSRNSGSVEVVSPRKDSVLVYNPGIGRR